MDPHGPDAAHEPIVLPDFARMRERARIRDAWMAEYRVLDRLRADAARVLLRHRHDTRTPQAREAIERLMLLDDERGKLAAAERTGGAYRAPNLPYLDFDADAFAADAAGDHRQLPLPADHKSLAAGERQAVIGYGDLPDPISDQGGLT